MLHDDEYPNHDVRIRLPGMGTVQFQLTSKVRTEIHHWRRTKATFDIVFSFVCRRRSALNTTTQVLLDLGSLTVFSWPGMKSDSHILHCIVIYHHRHGGQSGIGSISILEFGRRQSGLGRLLWKEHWIIFGKPGEREFGLRHLRFRGCDVVR
jgi:hypothetical protein